MFHQDFRSSDGLYALVKQQHPDVVLKGRDLFDASLFRDKTSTAVFYTFISQLKHRIDSATPTPTHRFIKTLDTKQKLLRSYTQNIDGFEERVGLRGSSSQGNTSEKGKSRLRAAEVRNIQLHGDVHRVRCTLCSLDLPCTEGYLGMFDQGMAPDCPECKLRGECLPISLFGNHADYYVFPADARLARSARPLKVGSLRPAIVLYDEVHPLGDDIGLIQTQDITRKPDMLIIMGTSLKVHGLKKLVKDFAKVVHASKTSTTGTPRSAKSWQGKVVFVNKTPPGSEWGDVIDYHVSGETDCWVEKVLEDWKKMRPSDWEVQQTLDVDGVFKVAKESASVVTQKKCKFPILTSEYFIHYVLQPHAGENHSRRMPAEKMRPCVRYSNHHRVHHHHLLNDGNRVVTILMSTQVHGKEEAYPRPLVARKGWKWQKDASCFWIRRIPPHSSTARKYLNQGP